MPRFAGIDLPDGWVVTHWKRFKHPVLRYVNNAALVAEIGGKVYMAQLRIAGESIDESKDWYENLREQVWSGQRLIHQMIAADAERKRTA